MISCLDLMELPKTLHSQIKAAGVTNILDMDFHKYVGEHHILEQLQFNVSHFQKDLYLASDTSNVTFDQQQFELFAKGVRRDEELAHTEN